MTSGLTQLYIDYYILLYIIIWLFSLSLKQCCCC